MKEQLSSQDLLTARFRHKKSALSFAIIIIALLVCVSSVFAFQVPTANYSADAWTVLLIHGDQDDGTAGTDILDSETTPKTITAVGNAQVDTAQYKNLTGSTGSILFDGTGDYLSLDDSTDWDLDTNFAMEEFIRWNTTVGNSGTFGQRVDASDNWWFGFEANILYFVYRTSSSFRAYYYASWTPSANTWYHIALARSGSTCYIFVDGTPLSVTVDTAFNGNLSGIAAVLAIGIYQGGNSHNGWQDEIRYSVGTDRWISTPRRMINITYGVDIGDLNQVGTPLWSCKIKALCWWKNFSWKYLKS